MKKSVPFLVLAALNAVPSFAGIHPVQVDSRVQSFVKDTVAGFEKAGIDTAMFDFDVAELRSDEPLRDKAVYELLRDPRFHLADGGLPDMDTFETPKFSSEFRDGFAPLFADYLKSEVGADPAAIVRDLKAALFPAEGSDWHQLPYAFSDGSWAIEHGVYLYSRDGRTVYRIVLSFRP